MISSKLAAVIAANRFGLGARPGEITHIGDDPRGWLIAQLDGERKPPAALAQLPASPAAFKVYADFLTEKKEIKKEIKSTSAEKPDAKDTAKEELSPLRKAIRETYLQQVAARYQVATHSEESFRESLVHFWCNHFAVSADKFIVSTLAGTMENEAIRPNIHRHFYDLLLAAESHPAMILFLDNQQSIGADSPAAELAKRRRRADRKLDINENLAREILELHTLGVNGGYTQSDVTSFARVLTGWSVGGGNGRFKSGTPGTFLFREMLHEPDAQTILGKRYSQQGMDQVLAVLKDLSGHPSTAKFVATKLVRHFIADIPPSSAVEQVAKAFRDSDGHLPTVHRAVVNCAEAWQDVAPKFKTPHEFVVSTFRTFDYLPPDEKKVFASFELLGQRPYTPGSPAGWPDTASQWDGADALMKRIEWATQVAHRAGSRISPLELADRSLGASLSEHTRTAIANASDAEQGITLWLASPEFQRR